MTKHDRTEQIEVIYGYNLPIVRYLPKVDTDRPISILIWFHGSYETEKISIIRKEVRKEIMGYRSIAQELNSILIMPVIPRSENFDAQILERSVMFDSNGKYFRTDLVISEVIQSQINYFALRYKNFNKKILGLGVSGGANFLNRFSILYPEYFSKVVLLLTGTFMLPLDKKDGVPLDYPLGCNDISGIRELNFSEYKRIRFFVGHSSDDNNPGPIEYEFRNNAESLQKILHIVGKTNRDRADIFVNTLKSQNINVTYAVFKSEGHELTNEVMNHAIGFLYE